MGEYVCKSSNRVIGLQWFRECVLNTGKRIRGKLSFVETVLTTEKRVVGLQRLRFGHRKPVRDFHSLRECVLVSAKRVAG